MPEWIYKGRVTSWRLFAFGTYSGRTKNQYWRVIAFGPWRFVFEQGRTN